HANPPIKEMNENMKDTANKLANLLLKIFIENGTTLIQLNIITTISEFPPIQSEIFHSLEQNGQFFSHLQELFLYTDSGKFSNDLIMLLRSLVKVSTNIHTLKLRETHWYRRSTINYDPQTLDVLAVFIRSQRKLSKLDISYEKSDSFSSYTNSYISYIDVILNHCNAPLERLIFHYINKEITDAVIAFCNRKKTLKYCCDMNGPQEEWLRLKKYDQILTYKYIVVYC
ncbi:9600_t:CDS:2, partial [Gigaspora rosea]